MEMYKICMKVSNFYSKSFHSKILYFKAFNFTNYGSIMNEKFLIWSKNNKIKHHDKFSVLHVIHKTWMYIVLKLKSQNTLKQSDVTEIVCYENMKMKLLKNILLLHRQLVVPFIINIINIINQKCVS